MAGGIPPLLQIAGSAAAIVVGGILAASVIAETVRIASDKRKRKTAPPCNVCKGKGFYQCKLCKGSSTIEWSPLHDPIAINPCVCPTCDGNSSYRVQRCLNCIGRGYAT